MKEPNIHGDHARPRVCEKNTAGHCLHIDLEHPNLRTCCWCEWYCSDSEATRFQKGDILDIAWIEEMP